MKTTILSMMAVFAMMWGEGAVRDSLAQTRSETPLEHARPDHQMNGPSDGAFHRRFEDAEKWAKEFDNPERDAWQKPEEILDALICSALRLSPISVRAPVISACGLQSGFQKAKYLPPLNFRQR
jgi:hypothetical protein